MLPFIWIISLIFFTILKIETGKVFKTKLYIGAHFCNYLHHVASGKSYSTLRVKREVTSLCCYINSFDLGNSRGTWTTCCESITELNNLTK